jgi:hypothetical protein
MLGCWFVGAALIGLVWRSCLPCYGTRGGGVNCIRHGCLCTCILVLDFAEAVTTLQPDLTIRRPDDIVKINTNPGHRSRSS